MRRDLFRIFFGITILIAATAMSNPPTTQPSQDYRITGAPLDRDHLPFFICERDGKLFVLSEGENLKCWPARRYFQWEGGASSFGLSNSKDQLVMDWHLDIAGPGWFEVTLTQNKDGSIDIYDKIVGRKNDDRLIEKHYASFKELADAAEKEEVASDVINFMKRIGIDCPLSSYSVLKDILTEKKVEVSKEMKSDLVRLIAQLDDDDCNKRDEAQSKLMNMKYFFPLRQVVDGMKLTPEQESRVACVIYRFHLPEDEGVREALKESK